MAAAASEVVGPRDLIPVVAFDDEVYAKGCLKGRDLCAMFCLTETDCMYDFSSERGDCGLINEQRLEAELYGLTHLIS